MLLLLAPGTELVSADTHGHERHRAARPGGHITRPVNPTAPIYVVDPAYAVDPGNYHCPFPPLKTNPPH
jgi:hypothetical protein